MRALVVYESMFGNTDAVARAVAEGLAEMHDVDLREVSQAPAAVIGRVDLIVVGGPTHAFSLSRPATRASAFEQGGTHGNKELGIREWLGRLRRGSQSEFVAVFDTRIEKARRLPGSAAVKAAKLASHLGYATAGRQSFYVSDTSGPLLPGELERARAWGSQLALEMSDRAHGRAAV
jgi:flavodoxin